MPRTRVPISHLAAFAADPSGYRARKGGPLSAAAAASGRRFHESFARSEQPAPSWRVVAMGALALLVLVLVLQVAS